MDNMEKHLKQVVDERDKEIAALKDELEKHREKSIMLERMVRERGELLNKKEEDIKTLEDHILKENKPLTHCVKPVTHDVCCATCFRRLMLGAVCIPAKGKVCTDWIPTTNLWEQLNDIPAVGADYEANRYDSDDKMTLHVWSRSTGQSYDVECPKKPKG